MCIYNQLRSVSDLNLAVPWRCRTNLRKASRDAHHSWRPASIQANRLRSSAPASEGRPVRTATTQRQRTIPRGAQSPAGTYSSIGAAATADEARAPTRSRTTRRYIAVFGRVAKRARGSGTSHLQTACAFRWSLVSKGGGEHRILEALLRCATPPGRTAGGRYASSVETTHVSGHQNEAGATGLEPATSGVTERRSN